MVLLIVNGFDGVADAVSLLMNTAMQIERSRYLQAEPYERTEQRQSYANGYKAKTFKTRVGKVDLAVSQTRDCEFYPQSLNVDYALNVPLKSRLPRCTYRMCT